MKPVINPEYLRTYGWRFIPEHDAPAGALGMLTQAIPECWKHDDWGEAATAEEADAITQANCCRVGPYDPIHVGPAPLSPSQESFAEGLIKLGEEKQGIRHNKWWVGIDMAKGKDETVRHKPSLLARLFSRIGQKRRGWSGPRED